MELFENQGFRVMLTNASGGLTVITFLFYIAYRLKYPKLQTPGFWIGMVAVFESMILGFIFLSLGYKVDAMNVGPLLATNIISAVTFFSMPNTSNVVKKEEEPSKLDKQS